MKLHVVEMTDAKNNNIWYGLVAVLGALIMMIGVFLQWATIGGANYSGWDLYSNGDIVSNSYVPLAVLILGILSFIIAIVPMVKHNTGKISGALVLIFSIIGIALTALLYMSIGDVAGSSVGAGLWVALVGGILALLGSFVDIMKLHE